MILSAGIWTREWKEGRIAVLPYSLNEPVSENTFLNRSRKIQMESVLEWLGRKALPVKIEGVPDIAVVCRRSANTVLIGLANYAHDDADDYALVIPALANRKSVTVRMTRFGKSTTIVNARIPVTANGMIALGKRFAVPSMEVAMLEIE